MDPHQRYIKKYQAKIADNDKIIAGQKLEIEQLKNQSAVLKLKRNEALKAIQEAASREEAELQYKLKLKRDKLEADIKDLDERKLKLEIETQELLHDISNQETAKKDLIDSVNELTEAKKSLLLSIKDRERSILELSRKIEHLTSEENTLEQSINGSKDTRIESEKLLEAVKNEIAEHEGKKSIAEREFETKNNQMVREISDLDYQLTQKIQMLREVSDKDKEMRESLAKKQTELEKREEVIRRRESIVSVSEQKIKNNVSMLKL